MSDAEAENVVPDSSPPPLPEEEPPQAQPKSTVLFLSKPAGARKNASASNSSASSSDEESEAHVQMASCNVILTNKVVNVDALAETELPAGESSPAAMQFVQQSEIAADAPTDEHLEAKERSPSPQSGAAVKDDGAMREEKLKEIRASLEPFEISANDSEVVSEQLEGSSEVVEDLKTTSEVPANEDAEEHSAPLNELSGDSAAAPDVETVAEETQEAAQKAESSESAGEGNASERPEAVSEQHAPQESDVRKKIESEMAAPKELSEEVNENKQVESPVEVVEAPPVLPQEVDEQQAAASPATPTVEITAPQKVEERKEVPPPEKIEAVATPVKEQPSVEKIETTVAPVLLPESPPKPTPAIRQMDRPVAVVFKMKPPPQQQQTAHSDTVAIEKCGDKAEAKAAGAAPVKKTDDVAQSSTAGDDTSGAKKADDKPATHKKRKCNIL